MRPAWLALFAPLPEDARLERKPVLPEALRGRPGSEAIEGWQNLSINLSCEAGLRHVMVTLDASGAPISGGDWVLVEEDGLDIHDNVGGRLEADGSFRGTRWRTVMREVPGQDEPEVVESVPSTPSDADVAAIKRLVAELLERASRG